MKTKRTNRVAKIAFTLLIVVALFFSIGAGYPVVEGKAVICETIVKYDVIKVVAEAVHFEEKVEEVAVAEIEKDEEVVEEAKEEEIEETVETEVVTEEVYEVAVQESTAAVETVSAPVEETTAVVTETQVVEEPVVAEPVSEVVEEYVAPAVQEWSIGLPGGYMNYYTAIGYDTLCNNLQGMIDAGYIVKYNNYFAGHNPGAMGHLSSIGVGSVVRVSYGNGEYYDYTIVAHATGSGSFADVTIGGYNLWDLVQSGGFVIQFCRNGSNNFFYGV